MTPILTDDQVRYIRQSIAANPASKNDLAVEFGIGEKSIRNIVNGRHYKHVDGAFKITNTITVPDETRLLIRDLYNRGHSMYDIKDQIGVSRNTIAKVLKEFDIDTSKKNNNTAKVQIIKRGRVLKHVKVYKPSVILNDSKLAVLNKFVKAGWTKKEIADMLNINVKDVQYYIEQNK